MSSSSTILNTIITRKRQEVADRKLVRSVDRLLEMIEVQASPLQFTQQLVRQVKSNRSAVIAEMKRASPSKGLLRGDFQPEQIAMQYELAGASCISVLTDHDFFQGSDEDLLLARKACELPIIRKDFMVDPYQILESRALGADCVLLIVAALNDNDLNQLFETARAVDLDVLVEVHDESELHRALNLDNQLIGINNRNLHTFETSLDVTLQLLNQIPDNRILITESGILEPKDVDQMHNAGVYGFLVGEAFMRHSDPGLALTNLFRDLA